jgi:hypothetical protein
VTTTERNFTPREIGNLIVKYGLMILLLIGFWWYTTTQSCETKMAVHKLLQPTHFGVEDLNYIKRKEYEIRLNQIIGI